MNKCMKACALLLSTVAFAAPAFSQGGKNTGPQLVKDVDQPARRPWAQQFILGQSQPTNDFLVPSDKRVVVESYSVGGPSCWTDQGSHLRFSADIFTNNITNRHFLKADRFDYAIGFQVRSEWLGTGTVRLYLDPGSLVHFAMNHAGATALPITCRITLSGHLVDPQ
ncbi:MAG: hypothetical protein ACRD5G_14830 [Candidatus Acidiferrales bacterium]